MAISKVIFNGQVLMDVTNKTVDSDNLLSNETALKNDGTNVVGGIISKSSSDLTASGATVTAPAGYYAQTASKSVASGTVGTPTAEKGTVSNHSVSITPYVTYTAGFISSGTKSGTAVSVKASELVSGTLTISSSGTKDVTNYASASVAAGTEGTPTATKGTVSNHSITITPSVTNTAGYITGGTKTGTAVTVNVSELESGTKTITENGTGISVSGYSAVDVNVAGESINVQPLSISLNGTYTAPSGSAYNPVTVNVEGGGGSAEKKQVNFIDYDGTLLYSYTATEANALTALPANPGHAGLVSQGWNWTLAQIKSQLTAQPDMPVWVGQMYITQSGATEIDVTITAPELHPYLGIAVDGTVTIDWGDNTTPDTVTGTSNTSAKFTGHEYAAAGDYTISISVVSGRFTFHCNSSAYASVLSETAEFNRSNRYSSDITTVRLGENAYIGQNAFTYCTALTSITIPNSVTSIGSYTFQNCRALTNIIIPDGVTIIGDYVFQNCLALTSIIIPDGVTSIGINAFQYCYALTNITIPDGVTSIGNQVFSGCDSLTSIAIPNGATSIGTYVFQNCYALTSITISDNMTSIGNYAFNNCYALTSITIPDGVTSIADSVFRNCYTLTSITIPDGVTSIGSNAIAGCYSLTNITIPNGVTSIGQYAFQNCYALTSITIPDGVTSIGSNAFNGCYGIREMHFKPTTPPSVANSNAFGSTFASGATIYVPTGCLTAYTGATNYPSSSTYTYVEE